MALVNVINMVVLDNPTNFANPFQFEITFECLQELQDDLEWKVLYVGSAHDSTRDQTLDEILVGPIPVGVNKFVLQADAPDPSRLPPDEILGVTVVLVTCSYREREFVRVGYYVNNEYIDPAYQQKLQDHQQECEKTGNTTDPPKPPIWPNLDLSQVQRQILADKPRVTKFPIPWGDETNTADNNNTSEGNTEGMDTGNGNDSVSDQKAQPRVMDSPATTAASSTAMMDVDMEQ